MPSSFFRASPATVRRGLFSVVSRRRFFSSGHGIPGFSPIPFSVADFQALCRNPYGRFDANSEVVGHIVTRLNGQRVLAFQFQMPDSDVGPKWQPLRGIRPMLRYGKAVLQAQTNCGATLYARNSYRFVDQNQVAYRYWPFSLPPKGKSEPFWQFKVKQGYTDSCDHVKGGKEILVVSGDVVKRMNQPVRRPSQHVAMGMSARDAIRYLLLNKPYLLNSVSQRILTRSLNTRNFGLSGRLFSPEWLHAAGYILSPMSTNPQHPHNLGCGPSWANSGMMVLESFGLFFAKRYPDLPIKIKPTFYFLPNTEVIQSIDFEVQIGGDHHFYRFRQHISPLQTIYPVLPRASDVAQLQGVINAMFWRSHPYVSSEVKGLRLIGDRESDAAKVAFLRKSGLFGVKQECTALVEDRVTKAIR